MNVAMVGDGEQVNMSHRTPNVYTTNECLGVSAWDYYMSARTKHLPFFVFDLLFLFALSFFFALRFFVCVIFLLCWCFGFFFGFSFFVTVALCFWVRVRV